MLERLQTNFPGGRMNNPISPSSCPDLELVSDDGSATPRIRLAEALRHLRHGTPFVASAVDGICAVRIHDYQPLVCVALHDGSRFPLSLEKHCLLSSAERRFEEDPHTARLVERLPLVLSGLESRYYYDLNRAENFAVAGEMFDRRVWSQGEHPDRRRALSRHGRFYRLMTALLEGLIARFGSCLVLDLHSYNASKHLRPTPVFNLGTCANSPAHRPLTDLFLGRLAEIQLPGVAPTVAENDVFEGRGRFVNWLSRSFPEAVPLCLEVKKEVYCDEQSGRLRPEPFTALQNGLVGAIGETFSFYRRHYPSQARALTANP